MIRLWKWWTKDRAGTSVGLPLVSAAQLRAWLKDGDTLLIDIREVEEHARLAIPGAASVPLSNFPPELATAEGIKRVVFHCQSGARTRLAANRLAASTPMPTFSLDRGLSSWNADLA